jgi:hypothetical protein
VALVLVLALVGAQILLLKPEDPGLLEARKACKSLSLFEQGIERKSGANEVLRNLAEAEKHGKLAANRDPQWVPLLGGIQSVRVALNEDDAQAAQVGIGVTRTECQKTG